MAGPRPGLAMALVVALAAAGNAATNLLVPAALYVPTALLVALLAVLVAVRVGGCGARDLGRAGSLLAPVMLHVATNSLAYAAAWVVRS